MRQFLRDYITALKVNLAASGGLAAAALGWSLFCLTRALLHLPWSPPVTTVLDFLNSFVAPLAFGIGIFTFLVTGFASGTYQAYVRTREHILRHHGTLAPTYQAKYSQYCSRAGVKAAAREAHLLHALIPVIAATWIA